MPRISKPSLIICTLFALCQGASADILYDVTLDTSSLVGHPAGPFYVELAFIDGSGIGDANNTATLTNFNFGGGSALGNPLALGGSIGSLETGVTMVDNTFLSLLYEQFAPGLQLSFSLGLTSNDDAGGIPDRFTFFILDSSGVPLPTLAPGGDYVFGADLGSGGPVFDSYGGDVSRAPSVGDPISFAAPTIKPAVPEPSSLYLLGGALATMIILRRRVFRFRHKNV